MSPFQIYFFTVFLSCSCAFSQDTLKFHQNKTIYLVQHFSSSGYQLRTPAGTSNYEVNISLLPHIGYFIMPQLGAGITGSYNFSRSNVSDLPAFHFYGLFLDYYPFKKRNLFITTHMQRSNVCLLQAPNIVSPKDKWLYAGGGIGSGLRISRYLNFIIEAEYQFNINDCDCNRSAFSIHFGLMFLPMLI